MTEPGLGTPEGTASFLAAGGAAKRAGLAAGPRAVYQTVLRAFAETGRPPGPGELEDTGSPAACIPARCFPGEPVCRRPDLASRVGWEGPRHKVMAPGR
jgi:hypothetical protein